MQEHATFDEAERLLPTPRIGFSDEQALLLEAATSFCRDHAPSATVRAHLGSDTGFDPAVWQAMVQLGWLGLAIPEAHGGSGLGIGHAAVIAEPMGRHLLATPFSSCQLAVQGLLAAGDAALQAQATWLPRIAQGSIASVALLEADGDWTLRAPQARARADQHGEGQVQLHGEKTLVADAAVAELLLVSVHDEASGGPALAVLPATALPPGALRRDTVVDETRRAYTLRLDGVVLPAAALVTGAAAQQALRAIEQAAWLLGAAEAAGGIAGVLDVVVDYLNTRNAFGRKIGSYQGLKHPCADILVGLERSRSHVAHAATLLLDSGTPAAELEVALRMAQAEAKESFVFAGDRAVQFHGGFGFTWDCNAQLYLRRALWLQAWFGDAAHHRRRLAGLLLPTG